MKKAIALTLLLSLLLALSACAGSTTKDEPAEQSAVPTLTEKSVPPAVAYDGELPENLLGVFDEESYDNEFFGVEYKRDGNWNFYTLQELASLNVGTEETALRNRGYVYDMYARSGMDTLGFTVAIPAVQYGKTMTETEYAQATKDASARDYAGADYDVVSGELGTVSFGGEEHACFDLSVAANGMIFYTKQIFIQRGDYIGVVYVSSQTEEGRTRLLNSFS